MRVIGMASRSRKPSGFNDWGSPICSVEKIPLGVIASIVGARILVRASHLQVWETEIGT